MKFTKILKYFAAISLIFAISIVSLSFKDNKSNPETNKDAKTEDDQIVFWFYVNVKIDEKTDTYKTAGTQSGINAGYPIDFEKELWKNLSVRKIAVGPFLTKNEALNAHRLYKSSEDKVKAQPVDSVPDQVYWFAIDFKQSDRLRIFIITRNPAAVQSGTEKQFVDAFYEQLQYKHFAIGPFYDYDQAEIAKRFYRMNE